MTNSNQHSTLADRRRLEPENEKHPKVQGHSNCSRLLFKTCLLPMACHTIRNTIILRTEPDNKFSSLHLNSFCTFYAVSFLHFLEKRPLVGEEIHCVSVRHAVRKIRYCVGTERWKAKFVMASVWTSFKAFQIFCCRCFSTRKGEGLCCIRLDVRAAVMDGTVVCVPVCVCVRATDLWAVCVRACKTAQGKSWLPVIGLYDVGYGC